MGHKNFRIVNPATKRAFRNFASTQFSRENDIEGTFAVPKFCVVIGLGGIGSHVAEILGSLRGVELLMLFDNDKIELHNLNRTAYNYLDVDCYKVEKMAESIARRNVNTSVIPIPELFTADVVEDIITNNLDDYKYSAKKRNWRYATVHFFDCRDDDFQDHDVMDKLRGHFGFDYKKVWRGAYNGTSITVDGHSKDHPCWGEPGYTIIPSHSLPSRLVALLTVIYASTYDDQSWSMYDMQQSLTFNAEDIIDHLFRSITLRKMGNNHRQLSKGMYNVIWEYIKDPEQFNGKQIEVVDIPEESEQVEHSEEHY